MAIIKSFAPFQNLFNFQVFENDEAPNSEYFRITELQETFTGGKNGFLIEGSEHLKETTEVKIEILDVEGNPIYFEPGNGIPEYYEGLSKPISIHVYDDTPIGIGKVTILGELKTYINDLGAVVDVPEEWKGVYNVKWQRDVQINKNISNESTVRFYRRPLVAIGEIVKPIFSKIINDSEDTGSINGFPLQPPLGQNLSEWGAGTNYLLQRTSGTFDVDVDENLITITSGSSTNIVHTATIVEVLNDTDLVIDKPFVDSNGKVANFSSFTGSVAYQDITNETIGETSITGSFAKIDITQLKTFIGDVARVKIFRKSRNAVGDFQFVQEAKLESQELLKDVLTVTDTEVFFGKFTDDVLSNYWISSSNDHPISTDSSILSRAARVDYNNSAGGTQQLITSQSINVSKDVEYTLEFKTLISGSISTDKNIRAFFSSSDFTQDFLTVSGSTSFNSKQDISQNIIAQNSGSAKLVIEVSGDDWYISNVSLRNAQDTSFSPDEFTIIQDIPRKTATETFDFRFEFYDVNNNFIPVDVTATKEFDGGNDFPTSGKLFTFESDRNAFRFSSGSIGNPPFQQLQFKTSQQNLTGSVTFASAAFDEDGVFINPSSYTGQYPGALTSVTPNGAIITIANFSGSDDSIVVGSIVYTASLQDNEEFETVFRLEDGDNAPQLIVTSNANQFIYEPTTLSPKPSGQGITVRAQRKNLASLVTPVTVNSGSNKPPLNFVETVNGIDSYTISSTQFSSSFASNNFDEVTYQFTGSDVFGNEQTDEITISKVINFDAVSLVLSNESTSFPAKSTGEVLGNLVQSSGSVQMFIGSNQITHDDELGGRTKNTFNITSSIGDNVTPTDTTPNTSNYSISAFETSKDSGSLTLAIDYLAGDNFTTQSFQKIVSYTKSKKAVPTVLTKISPSTQTINSSSIGYDAPQTMEVIVQEGGDEYTFDSSNLSGGGDALAQKFNIAGLFVDSGSISNSDNILTFGSLTSSFNSIIGSASLDYVDSEGTYVTGKKVRFDLAVSKIGVDGVNGASGSNARAVSLSSDKYAIVYDGDGNLFPASQNFTLSGSAQNFNTPEFQFLSGGAVLHDFATTSEVVISSSGYPAAGTSIIYEVRTREQGGSYDGVFDNIDVFAVQSGSDAFTVFLTNEAHVFSATSESVVSASDLEAGEFEVRFFRGAEQYNSGSSGKTYSVTASVQTGIVLSQSLESNQAKFRPTSLSADNGKASIIVTDNNTSQTFNKEYTFSKSKAGNIGADGANGASGSNAKVVSLSSTKYAVVYDGDGVLFPTSQPFTLSGSAQNFTSPEFQFLEDGSQIQAFGVDTNVIIPTDAGSLPTAGASRLYEVRVRESGGSYEGVFDNIDVFGVQSGSDSFTTFLTNEAHVFSANSDGVVTSTLADGSFETRFFRGAEQYNFGTSGKTYSVSATSSSIELEQSTNSNQRKFTPTAASADNGSASITLTDNNTGQTFEKTYTFSKSKKGAPATVIFATPQTQTVTSGSVEGIGTPSVVDVIVNEGGSSNYTHTTGTVTANKFKITGVTNATNNNDGTITPSTPTSASPVSGVITLSYTNSEGTAFTSKTINFSVGVAGVGDQGLTGGQGDTGKRSATGVIYYQVSSASNPGTPSATAYNFSAQSFSSLTANWGLSAPTFAAGNSNAYWFSRFNVNESSSESNTGAPSFTAAVQAIGFTGLVTFTSANNISDGTTSSSIVEAGDVQSHIGGANTTNINGGVVSTGVIKSTNHTTGSGNGFTVAGTEFNLDTGQLASKKFFIDGGDAAFSGSISAEDGSIGGLFINNSQLIGGQGPIGKAGGKPFFTLDSGIGASWEYDGNDTVTGLFLAGITGSQGIGFNHNTYDNPFFTGSDFTGSAIAITDVGDDENVYIRLGNRNAYIKLTSEGSNGNGSLIISSSNFNITPGGDVQATNFQMTSGSLSITGNGSSANIDSQGTLTAVNANIDGTITANSGEIGGFTIDSSSLYSNGSTFARLQAGTTPSLIFYENAETASVKLTAEETLTAIDIGASPPDLLGSSYTSITAGGSDTAFSNSSSTLNVAQSGTSVTSIPTGNLRFPSSGNVPSEYDGVTATFTGTLTPQSVGYFVKIQAEAYSSNISFASVNSTIGIRIKKSGGSIVATQDISISVSQPGFGVVFNLEDNFSSKFFSLNFDMESGENYSFEVFSKNGQGVAVASGTGISINLCEWRQPRIGSIAVAMRGGENTPPFSELTRGGLQVVGNAAAGADKRAVKIPAASGVDTLQVTGSISATGDITAFNTSDERLKENIVTIVNPIEKIKQVKGVEFTWKPGFEKVHMFGTGSDIGVIAQDVQKILPQIVSENIFHNYLGVQYDKLTPLLVESVKELSKKIEELENKLKDKE